MHPPTTPPTPPYIIRPATLADAPAIIEVLNPIIRLGDLTAMDQPLSVEAQVAWMRAFPPNGVFLVAACIDTGRVLGLQDASPLPSGAPSLTAEVSTFVALNAQRLGIGRALTRATLLAAATLGLRTLTATIRADNPLALAFYQSQGFRIIGTIHNHARVRGALIDAVTAELAIS
jgi:L-amino acid N-acyltransferase YncA